MHPYVYCPGFGFYACYPGSMRCHIFSRDVTTFCYRELRSKLKHSYCPVSEPEKHPHAFLSVSDIRHKHIQPLLVHPGHGSATSPHARRPLTHGHSLEAEEGRLAIRSFPSIRSAASSVSGTFYSSYRHDQVHRFHRRNLNLLFRRDLSKEKNKEMIYFL